MARRLIGLDFETHYDSKFYTLRKMDIPSYICDPRFEATLVAVKEGANPAFIVDGPDIPRYLQGLGDPRDITLYGHNLMFDACIASWIYDWRAGLNICTLALARQTIQAYCRSLSLKSVLEYLGLPAKGGFLATVDGMRRDDIIQAGYWQQYCEYAVGDIDGSYGIYERLAPLVPPEEHVIADMVLRMATEPSFDLDQPLLQAHLEDVISKKEEMLAFAMIGGSLHGKDDLMSNDKFALVLQSLGIDPPTKMSPVTGKQAWAFAKSDEGMKELQEHPDPVVQAVVAARLGHKTTLEETRTARFLNCSTLTFPAYGVGKFPVPLKVSGAHTHRLSGDWKYNAQNMRRGGKLRKSLKAPPGYTVVVGDEKQIEARMAAEFSGQADLVEQFRLGVDTYAAMATKIFGFAVNRKIHVPQGFVGKTCVLSGMYGVGAPKFRSSVIHLSKEQTGTRIDVDVDLGPSVTSETIIEAYRRETWAITEMRKRLNNCIPMMAQPDCNFFVGAVQFLYQKIRLPNGHYLYYNKLRYDNVSGSWIYEYAGRWKRIYGGALLENIIQALARIVTMHAALRLRPDLSKYNWKLALQAHDELVLIVPDDHVDYAKQRLKEELTRQVTWMPNLPVDADIGAGPTYGDAK